MAPVIQAERGQNPRVLLIAFTGLAGRFNLIQPFDFFKLTGLSQYSRILLRDPYHLCYLKGIDPSGPEGLVERIGDGIKQLAPEKVIMMGVSAGGFAALLLGSILKPDYVHAFSPYGYVGFGQAFRHRDWESIATRWTTLVKMLFLPPEAKRHFDLLPTLEKAGPQTKFHIHACAQSSDAKRALRFRSCASAQVLLYPCRTHNVTWSLLRTKCMQELLKEENLEQAGEVHRRFYPGIEPAKA